MQKPDGIKMFEKEDKVEKKNQEFSRIDQIPEEVNMNVVIKKEKLKEIIKKQPIIFVFDLIHEEH
jgi:hypothetical protein